MPNTSDKKEQDDGSSREVQTKGVIELPSNAKRCLRYFYKSLIFVPAKRVQLGGQSDKVSMFLSASPELQFSSFSFFFFCTAQLSSLCTGLNHGMLRTC